MKSDSITDLRDRQRSGDQQLFRALEALAPQILVRRLTKRLAEGPNEMEGRQVAAGGQSIHCQRSSVVAVDELADLEKVGSRHALYFCNSL